MAQPFDKLQNRVTDLPNPELNPLLNPILGRNLGRWAQVYFTSPPEKREEAVIELLRELEGNSAPTTSDHGSPVPEALKAQTVPEFATCPECSQPNSKWQRFCGMCGAPLSPEERATLRNSAAPLKSQGNGHHEVDKISEPAQPQEQERAQYPTLSLFAAAEREPESWSSESSGNSDARWLRDQGFGADADEGSSKLGVYALATCSILVLAGVIFYAQFRSQHSVVQDLRPAPANTAQEAPSPQPSTPQPSAPHASAPQGSTQTSTASPSTTQTPVPQASQSSPGSAPANPPVTARATAQPPQPTTSQQPTPPATQHSAQVGGASHPVAGNGVSAAADRVAVPTAVDLTAGAAAKPVGGTVELATAQQYLSGKGRPRDSAAAATWLWAAVRKENPTAVLLLSQLYLAGDGVSKNCEQARVLLTSAARKNVPGAAAQLGNMQTSGCK